MLGHLDSRSASIISAFASVARPIIRTEYDVDSCIPSTRIAIDVFHHFDLRARPLVARMRAFNAAMGRCMAEGGPEDEATFERWDRVHGARTSSVGYAEGRTVPPGYWAGHLVAFVADRVLVDPSADQASRPYDSISVPGVLVAPVDARFVAGIRGLILRTSDGCGILYECSPSERSYRSAPFWKSTPTSRRVCREIIAAMRLSIRLKNAA